MFNGFFSFDRICLLPLSQPFLSRTAIMHVGNITNHVGIFIIVITCFISVNYASRNKKEEFYSFFLHSINYRLGFLFILYLCLHLPLGQTLRMNVLVFMCAWPIFLGHLLFLFIFLLQVKLLHILFV